MKNKKIGSGRVKGFTLIEMIVVIAIIAILAGVTSMFIEGYNRNAKIEANNKKAQQIYAAFQDILVDCEIKQDISMFNDSTSLYDDAIYLYFTISQDGSGGLSVNDSDMSGVVYKSGAYQTAQYLQPAKIKEVLEKRLDKGLSGSYLVCMDLDNYVVDSVICRELESVSDTAKIDLNAKGVNSCKKYQPKANYQFVTFIDMVEHKKGSRQGSAQYGCYPYLRDVYKV